MPDKNVHVSVRNIIEFVLRSGNIDSRYLSNKRALEGTKIHQKIQKKHSKETRLKGFDYLSEVTLKNNFEYKGFQFDIEGRADGIIEVNNKVYIEEIKSTVFDIENIEIDYNHWHWSQAKYYGYMYCLENNIKSASIVLTYCNIETFDEKSFEKEFLYEELEDYFYHILELYFSWVKLSYDLETIRNRSIIDFNFPYKYFRKGQREFCAAVYKTLVSNKKIFAQAPTGTGKTISTLFPSIKYIGVLDKSEMKIFYATAKNITRQVVQDSIKVMLDKGLKLKSVTITAKEKICLSEEKICSPQKCIYAKGHFDRINDAISDIIRNEDLITMEAIEQYSKKHLVCPFEFSLDIALFANIIICDYNYIFDPKVYLKRFFSEESKNKNHIVLIDEAHNLVDRAREMYSADLNKQSFLEIRRFFKNGDIRIYSLLTKINNFFNELSHKFDENTLAITENKYPEDFIYLIMEFISYINKWLAKNEGNENYNKILEIYFKSIDFIRISELFDKRYITFIQKEKKDIIFKLYCIDPSFVLSKIEKRLLSSIFFSATLTPVRYFMDILGGEKNDNFINILSPFNLNNLCIIIDTAISTKYSKREKSYPLIADRIHNIIKHKNGNYIVFFSSYDYMDKVKEIFCRKYTDIKILIQSQSMTEKEKVNFLDKFNLNNNILGFAVLGGIFSEGIDLIGDKLIGSIIIGVGLPLICTERNILKDYYNEKNSMGFEYAYIYPGMNKVLQAAGRVIRSENDKGIVFLIDDRYLNKEYLSIFPYEWKNFNHIVSMNQAKQILDKFWNN